MEIDLHVLSPVSCLEWLLIKQLQRSVLGPFCAKITWRPQPIDVPFHGCSWFTVLLLMQV